MEPESVVHCKPNKKTETSATAQLTVLHFMTPNMKEKAKIYNENEFPTLCSYFLSYQNTVHNYVKNRTLHL